MSVTFVVEDGSVVAGANSYVTVEYATDYLSSNSFVSPKWLALTLGQQQALLIWSTRYLDQRTIWEGIPATAAPVATGSAVIATWAVPQIIAQSGLQPLRWPRCGVLDADDLLIASNVIPPALMNATAEMARYLIDQDRSVERPQDGLKELKADVVTLVFAPGYTLPEVPDQISYILRGLGTIQAGRTGFAKISRS